MIEISINGKKYPCRATMGAMLRFHQETGREVTDIKQGSLSDLCVYLWCCVQSACKAEGKDFDMSLMDFADSIRPEDMNDWAQAVTEPSQGAAGDEKKSK